ncbi:hypothetical protein EDD85DRAFT_958614 [Armillaria nabsnona]|nr:hypothetical protein EDD85DRAFT_958614 [Armillaria nabsnona]
MSLATNSPPLLIRALSPIRRSLRQEARLRCYSSTAFEDSCLFDGATVNEGRAVLRQRRRRHSEPVEVDVQGAGKMVMALVYCQIALLSPSRQIDSSLELNVDVNLEHLNWLKSIGACPTIIRVFLAAARLVSNDMKSSTSAGH